MRCKIFLQTGLANAPLPSRDQVWQLQNDMGADQKGVAYFQVVLLLAQGQFDIFKQGHGIQLTACQAAATAAHTRPVL